MTPRRHQELEQLTAEALEALDPDHPDLLVQLYELRRELDVVQRRVSALIALAATLDLPDPARSRCPDCGLSLRGPATLAEHRYHSHGGPVPGSWERAEALAD